MIEVLSEATHQEENTQLKPHLAFDIREGKYPTETLKKKERERLNYVTRDNFYSPTPYHHINMVPV